METILNFSYEYFELEGIPPYTSSFVPIDFRYEWWIDKEDTQRFRFEKHFVTRVPPVNSGLMALTTSAGQGAKIIHTEIWDGLSRDTEKEHPDKTTTYQKWFDSFTTMGRRLTDEIGRANGSHKYVGVQDDERWGSVHVFQKEDIVQASDVYFGMPLIVTHKIHMNDFRWIEMKQKIINGGQEVLHRLWRLSNWVELNPDNLSLNAFEHTR
jgi:hypothetical protein